ncbi:MAG TPA: TMEM175 family protein [Candidatus Paceibacterota bacterium]|nr:TMEM175 family protein [Candidatus Paceibacterota bacterium]
MEETNSNARIEAFSDGVFAIALTLLILDVKLPATAFIHSSSDFWLALRDIAPSIFAFVLSFTIILISWVNHHNSFKLVNRSSASSIYANGFLLLTVVFMPFPTALLGQYLLTDYAAPAVVLYNAVIAMQSIGWILLGRAAIKNNLAKNEKVLPTVRQNTTYGYYAFILYTTLAIFAFWFPFAIAVITTLTWIFWLIIGIRTKYE